VANTWAYYNEVTITAIKRFIAQAHGAYPEKSFVVSFLWLHGKLDCFIIVHYFLVALKLPSLQKISSQTHQSFVTMSQYCKENFEHIHSICLQARPFLIEEKNVGNSEMI
jgi:hypothetical protein